MSAAPARISEALPLSWIDDTVMSPESWSFNRPQAFLNENSDLSASAAAVIRNDSLKKVPSAYC